MDVVYSIVESPVSRYEVFQAVSDRECTAGIAK